MYNLSEWMGFWHCRYRQWGGHMPIISFSPYTTAILLLSMTNNTHVCGQLFVVGIFFPPSFHCESCVCPLQTQIIHFSRSIVEGCHLHTILLEQSMIERVYPIPQYVLLFRCQCHKMVKIRQGSCWRWFSAMWYLKEEGFLFLQGPSQWICYNNGLQRWMEIGGI